MSTPQLERLGTHCQRLRLHRVEAELSTLLEQAAKKDVSYADFLDDVLALELEAKQAKHRSMRVVMALSVPEDAGELRVEVPAVDRAQGDQGAGDRPLHRDERECAAPGAPGRGQDPL